MSGLRVKAARAQEAGDGLLLVLLLELLELRGVVLVGGQVVRVGGRGVELRVAELFQTLAMLQLGRSGRSLIQIPS